jgi:outer membrane immunogenic protein
MARIWLALIGCVFGGCASTAELNWSSIYLGVHAGAGSSLGDWSPLESQHFQINSLGYLGGAQIGANYQFRNFVVGLEGEISGARIVGDGLNGIDIAARGLVDIAARFGVLTTPTTLLYAKLGPAWMTERSDFSLPITGYANSITGTTLGALFGVGAEFMIYQKWSVKAEYNYLDFGTRNLDFGTPLPGFRAVYDAHERMQTIKFGVNYRLP